MFFFFLLNSSYKNQNKNWKFETSRWMQSITTWTYLNQNKIRWPGATKRNHVFGEKESDFPIGGLSTTNEMRLFTCACPIPAGVMNRWMQNRWRGVVEIRNLLLKKKNWSIIWRIVTGISREKNSTSRCQMAISRHVMWPRMSAS